MSDNEYENRIPHGEVFEVDSFRPEDAKGIANLFRAVYGDAYPVRIFYDPQALRAANEDGTYYSIVARAADGKVVGAVHLFRSAPFEALYELGSGLVLQEYRNLGLNRRMFEFAFEQWVPRREGIEEVWGEPVCNHVINQKAVVDFRYIETALEVALMPAEAYDREKSASGRVAALSAFRCYRPKPCTVYLPSVYEKELTFLYSALDDERTILISDRSLPESVKSHADTTVFDFAGVCRTAMHSTGSDFDSYIREIETTARDRKVVVFQVWLNLSSPWVGAAADVLRDRGYFLGGLLPRWFDEDGLLMQKILTDPDFESVRLYSDRAKQIFAMVKEDWLRTRRG
ncbi:MAG: GNAT family N-acetyltransferase [Desulfomonilaceae bacterium]|nr:GNAT family N-acetyltransferase [Desulfomonilaceae bacterium]